MFYNADFSSKDIKEEEEEQLNITFFQRPSAVVAYFVNFFVFQLVTGVNHWMNSRSKHFGGNWISSTLEHFYFFGASHHRNHKRPRGSGRKMFVVVIII
jgi:hypothetical protein